MSFSLGGPGDILPPRSNQPSSRQIADQQSGGSKDPRSQPVKQPLVQESVPLDRPSRTTPNVAAGKQPVTIPQGRGASVTRIADRKPTTKAEAIQSAIAQATGNVIPLPNIKDITAAVKAGVMNPGGTWSQPVTNGSGLNRGGGFVDPTKTATAAGTISRGTRSTGTASGELSQAAQRKRITKDALCVAVGIVEAQRHGNSITISLNSGTMKVLSGEALVTAAKEASELVNKAVNAGDVTQQDVADCQAEYCKRAQCGTNHSTGTAEKPPDNATPTPTPPAPVATDTATGTATTGSTGTATSTGTTTIPDSMLPPSLPPVVLPDEPVRTLPLVKAPSEGMSTATKGFLWVAAAVAAYTLFKKLSGVKVVGAAMAGVPLIADLGDLEGGEDEDEEGGDDAETDSDENEE